MAISMRKLFLLERVATRSTSFNIDNVSNNDNDNDNDNNNNNNVVSATNHNEKKAQTFRIFSLEILIDFYNIYNKS